MLIFKCPECEDSLMGFNEAEKTWVCSESECQHELQEEEAQTLFEAGDLLAYVESDDEEELFEEEDEKDDDDDSKDSDKDDEKDDDDDDDSKDESFNGFANKDTWMVNLVVQNEYKVHKGAIAAITEADDAEKALQKFVEKTIAKDEAYSDILEGIDYEDISWDEIVESLNDAKAELSAIAEDLVTALGMNEGISEDDRNNVMLVFESALTVKLNELKANLEEKFEVDLEEAKDENFKKLTVEMSGYFDEIVEEWMEENKIAIEHGIRTEMTEQFMEGMRDLFSNFYMDIPEERFDILQDMSDKIEKMDEDLSESKAREAALQEQLNEKSKETIINKLSEDMTDTQVEKLGELAGSIDYESEAQFESELNTLKESFLTKATNRKDGDTVITEEVEGSPEQDEKKVDLNDPIALAARGMRRRT